MTEQPACTRDAAWVIVTEWTTNPVLVRHMLSVQVAIRAALRERRGAMGHPRPEPRF